MEIELLDGQQAGRSSGSERDTGTSSGRAPEPRLRLIKCSIGNPNLQKTGSCSEFTVATPSRPPLSLVLKRRKEPLQFRAFTRFRLPTTDRT